MKYILDLISNVPNVAYNQCWLASFTVNRKGFGGFVPLLVALARSVEHDFLENRSKVELDKPTTNTFL